MVDEALAPGRKEIWCRCGYCSWTWIVYGPLPAPVEVVSKAMRVARCPNCKAQPPKLLMAQEAEIAAALEKAA